MFLFDSYTKSKTLSLSFLRPCSLAVPILITSNKSASLCLLKAKPSGITLGYTLFLLVLKPTSCVLVNSISLVILFILSDAIGI